MEGRELELPSLLAAPSLASAAHTQGVRSVLGLFVEAARIYKHISPGRLETTHRGSLDLLQLQQRQITEESTHAVKQSSRLLKKRSQLQSYSSRERSRSRRVRP